MKEFEKALHGIVTFLAVINFLFVFGCAAKGPEKPAVAVFYPAPPELPRYQFLRSFSGAGDIEAKRSAFESFVTGVTESGRRLDKPYGVAMHDGKIYVCDTNATVMVFDLKEKKLSPLEGAKGIGALVQPININIDADGNKYVADPIRKQVMMYDKNDFYVRGYSITGAWKPVDAVVFEDHLYVVDSKNMAVKVFDKKSGRLTKTIGRDGKPEETLGLPTNLAIDRQGIIHVMDAGRIQIVKYDRDGHYLGSIGKPGQSGATFARPRGVALDKEGRIYAVDAAFDNVQVFRNDGQLLTFFGGPGRGPGNLNLAAKVFIDYDNLDYFREYADPHFEIEYLVFVSSQFGKRLISVYGFGKEKGRQYPSEEELTKDAEERKTKMLEDLRQKGDK